MIGTSALFYLPFVTFTLLVLFATADLQKTRAAIRAENRPSGRR